MFLRFFKDKGCMRNILGSACTDMENFKILLKIWPSCCITLFIPKWWLLSIHTEWELVLTPLRPTQSPLLASTFATLTSLFVLDPPPPTRPCLRLLRSWVMTVAAHWPPLTSTCATWPRTRRSKGCWPLAALKSLTASTRKLGRPTDTQSSSLCAHPWTRWDRL